MFVVKSGEALLTSGNTSNLSEGQVGVFASDYTALAAAPSVSTSPYIYIGEGSGNTELGSFKSSKIYLNKVTAWRGSSADTTGKEQITYVGWDEINQCDSPSIQCDKSYTVVIRVFEHYLRSAYCPYLQEGVVVKSACCADCSSNCDDLDCSTVFDEFAAKINANPRLNQYVTASVVKNLISGTPATVKYALVLPDPGTNVGGVVDFTYATSAAGLTNGSYTGVTGTASGSGSAAEFTVTVAGGVVTAVVVTTAGTDYVTDETITIAGTAITSGTTPADDIVITVIETEGAEGVLIGAVRAFYSSVVDDAQTDIVYSADTDSSDGDANATGNVMIELTPSAGVLLSDLEPYEGIAWVELPCADAGDAVYACGLKIVGTTPTGFNAPDCIPDSVPYIANKVRFKVYAGEAPSSSQLEDMPDFCNLWEIKNTQEIKYPIGEGIAIAELERNYAGYNQPYQSSHRYWIPYFNGDFITFADSALEYDIYELEYIDPSPSGFENKTGDAMAVMIAVPSSMTSWKTAFETIMNTYLANSPAYQASVTL